MRWPFARRALLDAAEARVRELTTLVEDLREDLTARPDPAIASAPGPVAIVLGTVRAPEPAAPVTEYRFLVDSREVHRGGANEAAWESAMTADGLKQRYHDGRLVRQVV